MANKKTPFRIFGISKKFRSWLDTMQLNIDNLVRIVTGAKNKYSKPLYMPDYGNARLLVEGSTFQLFDASLASIMEIDGATGYGTMKKDGWLVIRTGEGGQVHLGKYRWLTRPSGYTIRDASTRFFNRDESDGRYIPAMTYAPTQDTVVAEDKQYFADRDGNYVDVTTELAVGFNIASMSYNLYEYVEVGSELTIGMITDKEYHYMGDSDIHAVVMDVGPRHLVRNYATYPTSGFYPVCRGTLVRVTADENQPISVTYLPFAPAD